MLLEPGFSQITASRSGEDLVGSSRSSRSERHQCRARLRRMRQPPEKSVSGRVSSCGRKPDRSSGWRRDCSPGSRRCGRARRAGAQCARRCHPARQRPVRAATARPVSPSSTYSIAACVVAGISCATCAMINRPVDGRLFVGGQAAEDQREQARLPGTVGTGQAGPSDRGVSKRGALEQQA